MVNKRRHRPTASLDQALALVTGAGSGIGRSTALALASKGSRVLVVDVNQAAAEDVASRCVDRGGWAKAMRCDVADWPAMHALAGAVEDELGPVDVLVNNAGVAMTGSMLDMSIEDWRWIRSINLDGVVHGCRAFAPAMLARGSGHVVNVSSGLGYTPRATEPAYVTTKAAVLALSRCLRAEWAPAGVGVSAVCPGIIDTPITTTTRFLGSQDTDAHRAGAERLFRRGHSPDLVAEAIVASVVDDRAVVPVGWEARLGWIVHRLAPLGLQDRIARHGTAEA